MAGSEAALSAAASTGLTSERVRARMVERIRELGVRDARVLAAMQRIERHRFVDAALASRAYDDDRAIRRPGNDPYRPPEQRRPVPLKRRLWRSHPRGPPACQYHARTSHH